MSSSESQSHILAHRSTVAATSAGHSAPVIQGVLHALVIAVAFWVSVGYLVFLLT